MKTPNYTIRLVALFLLSSVAISTSADAGTYRRQITVQTIEAESPKTIAVSVHRNRGRGNAHKFQLDETYRERISVRPEAGIDTEYITLDVDGNLTLMKGFSWNGATGTIDTKTILRGSMVHDALYQLMREGKLDRNQWRETADTELGRICREDGMGKLRASIMRFVVRRYGEKLTRENNKNSRKKVLIASIQANQKNEESQHE